MRFILSGLGNWYRSWKLMQEAVPLADELGFWGVVIPDHYMWQRRGESGPAENSTLESWVALTYLAAKTRRLKLGTLVTPIPFRPPAMIAKMVSTLDVLSNGRTIFGVGAGWSQTEFEGYSVWNDAKTRVDKTEEGLRLILRLWQEEKVDFDGKFYHSKGAVLDPKPVQKPHPMLLFGGFSPRMLRMAGRYADVCFLARWLQMPFDKAKATVEAAARRARRQGKLAFATGSPVSRDREFDVNGLKKDVEKAAEQGCRYYLTPFPQTDYVRNMRQFAKDVMPSYAEL